MLKDKTSIFYELIFNLEKQEAYRLVQIAKFNSLNKEQLAELEDEKLTTQDTKNDTDANENDALLPKN